MKKRRIFYLLICALIFLSPIICLSQSNTNTETNTELFRFDDPNAEAKGPGYFGMVVKTLFVLGIFTAGIYYIFKYISKKQGLAFPKLDIISIVSSVPVGTNRFVQVIEVGNKYYLIGSTDNNITMLSEIEDKETINRIKILKNKKHETSQAATFAGFLENILGGISKKIIKKDNTKFVEKQTDRLKNMKF